MEPEQLPKPKPGLTERAQKAREHLVAGLAFSGTGVAVITAVTSGNTDSYPALVGVAALVAGTVFCKKVGDSYRELEAELQRPINRWWLITRPAVWTMASGVTAGLAVVFANTDPAYTAFNVVLAAALFGWALVEAKQVWANIDELQREVNTPKDRGLAA